MAVFCFVSCSEEDEETVEEFPEWQAKNDAYFSQLVADVNARKTAGETSWDLIASYTKPDKDYVFLYSDYVVVEKLSDDDFYNYVQTMQRGVGMDNSPYQGDTVTVHYVGNLLPSANQYKEYGMEFDRSYSEPFAPDVATPTKMAVGAAIDGFSTALQRMRRGEHWRVYIPYQLGYGAAASGSIPAYSTLIFDLRLEDFWQKEKGDRD